MRIPDSDDALLVECVVETFRSSGPGGQNVNTRDKELRDRLEALNRPKRRRIRTKVPRRVRAKVREGKKRRSLKKGLRRKPDPSD